MRPTGILLLITILISLAIPGVVGAALSADQFRGSNFNLYSSRCPANDMKLRDLQGRTVSLSGLRGKVVILNFWKIDCPPCAMEKPILERIYRQYGPRGLAILSVNLFDNYNRIVSYVQSKGLTFTVAYDPEKHLSVRSQTLASGHCTNFVVNPKSEAIYEIAGVPTTYVIDRNGRIVGHCSGMINWEQPPFPQLLESLLGPRPHIFAQRNQTGRSSIGPIQSVEPTMGSGRNISELDQASAEPQPTRYSSNGKRWQRVARRPDEGTSPKSGVAQRDTPTSSSRVATPVNGPIPSNISPSRQRQSKRVPDRQMPRVVINPGVRQSSNSDSRIPAVRRPTSQYLAAAEDPTYNSPTQRGSRPPSALPPATNLRNPQNSPTNASKRTNNTANSMSMPRPATLPPAARYSPPTLASTPYGQTRKKKRQPEQVIPASNDGYIVARVPGARAVSGGPATTVGRTYSRSNAVGSFLLESFPGSPLPAQPTPVQYQPQRPAPSFFQRVGNWGSGIRNVFGNIIPAQ
jgi:thiol-disulfide isomerase/thioredoxin